MNTENDTQSTQTMNNTAGQLPADPGQVTANTATQAPPAPEPAPLPQPFDRQPGESEKAFAAFRYYLEMGPRRSISAAARQLGFPTRRFQRFAKTFHWRSRALAYEEHMAQIRQHAQEEALLQQTIDSARRNRLGQEEQWRFAQFALQASRQFLSLCLDKSEREIRLPDVTRCFEAAAKLHRQAAGLDQPPPPPPPDPNQGIHPDIIAALERAYGDPTPEPSTRGPQPATAPATAPVSSVPDRANTGTPTPDTGQTQPTPAPQT